MAITKSKGNYFTEEARVWEESLQIDNPPYYLGQWNGKFQLPERPTPDAFKPLFSGQDLPRIQKNRVGCYDVTFTASKSVSIVLFALTPPSEWKASGEAISKAASAQVSPLLKDLKINAGAQGATKLPAQGVASGFTHFLSHAGKPHAHEHIAIPNVAVAPDGKVGSIANAKMLFDLEGAMRAGFQKSLDDSLQRKGYQTVRVGKAVEVVGIPSKLIEEFSPARAAMNEARRSSKFTGPKAADFFARQARREVPRGESKSIEGHHAAWSSAAKKYGVTRESLRPTGDTPPLINDPRVSSYVAYCTAKDALASCTKKFGTFTAAQFLERVYLKGIGRPTTREDLQKEASEFLSRPKHAGVKKIVLDKGEERFGTDAGFKKQTAAERPFVKDSIEDLKRATGELAKAVLMKTADTAAGILRKITDAIKPSPTITILNARDVERFLAAHKPTPYLASHFKAIMRGIFASGNPHEKAGVAEHEYKRLRSHERLPAQSILLVENAAGLSASQLIRLAKLAKRDKSSVVLSGIHTGEQARSQAAHTQSNSRREHERRV